MTDIAITETVGEVVAVATSNGQAAFDFDFPIYAEAHLVVYLNYVDEDSDPLVLTTDYTVSGVEDENGGTVTLEAAEAATIIIGDELLIRREVPVERLNDYQEAGDFFAANLNRELDLLVMMLQEARRDIDAGGILGLAGVFAAIASQAEAEAGVNNTKGMTPARVAQAIAALAGRGLTSVRAATTTNITIATALNNGDTAGGVVLATGDLVGVFGQTAPAQNGIYVVGAVPARSTHFDAFNDHVGALVTVEEGTSADTVWLGTSDRGGALGVADIVFARVSSAIMGTIAALAVTDGNFIVGNGTAWVAESGATARASLGLGALAVLGYTDLVYTGSSAANVDFPIGTIVVAEVVGGSEPARNASQTIRLDAGNSTKFINTGAAAALTGTWRSRGFAAHDGADSLLMQRVA